MGKYPPSRIIKRDELNNAYSDWHYQNNMFGRHCLLTDIDQLWAEVRPNLDGELNPVAIFDIKEAGAQITKTEEAVYKWFERHQIPVFVVFTTIDFSFMTVRRWKSGTEQFFNKGTYYNFINSLPASCFL